MPSVVVVGARRRSPIGKALLGSTAQSVVLGATSPVLVVGALLSSGRTDGNGTATFTDDGRAARSVQNE